MRVVCARAGRVALCVCVTCAHFLTSEFNSLWYWALLFLRRKLKPDFLRAVLINGGKKKASKMDVSMASLFGLYYAVLYFCSTFWAVYMLRFYPLKQEVSVSFCPPPSQCLSFCVFGLVFESKHTAEAPCWCESLWGEGVRMEEEPRMRRFCSIHWPCALPVGLTAHARLSKAGHTSCW